MTSKMEGHPRLLILDRDGVINHDSDLFIRSPEEWIPIPGSMEAIARLNRGGWRIVVASNQSGLSRGFFTMSALNAMHQKMHQCAAAVGARIDAVFFCPHQAEAHCTCRKPLPGLYRTIAERYGVDLTDMPCIGDATRDAQAAAAVGARPYLVLTGKGLKSKDDPALPKGTYIFNDLSDVARHLAP